VAQRGVRDLEYDAPGTYRWLKCGACGLVRLEPFPTREVLSLAYPDHYHAYAKPSSAITRALVRLSKRKTAERLASYLPTGGTILDVGCSTGELLGAVGKLGNFQLWGVEYKAEAASEAEAHGIRVWRGEFEHADVPSASVDVVVLQHVLEHVSDPSDTLRKIGRALRPSGWLFGEVPNIDSLDARIFGPYWGGGHAPRHLWHFTPQTLRDTLHRSGFESLSVEPVLHTGHWALSVQNALRRHRRDSRDLTSGRAWYYPALLVALLPINLLEVFLSKTGVIRFQARRAP
jgi:SAM-dependent methyltransferase